MRTQTTSICDIQWTPDISIEGSGTLASLIGDVSNREPYLTDGQDGHTFAGRAMVSIVRTACSGRALNSKIPEADNEAWENVEPRMGALLWTRLTPDALSWM